MSCISRGSSFCHSSHIQTIEIEEEIAARRFRKCRDSIRGTSLVAFGEELKNALDELQTGKKKKNSSEHVWNCHRIKRR